jgi:hypothetical protein
MYCELKSRFRHSRFTIYINEICLLFIGSLENTFTQVYVYDLKKIHHYDHHNTFWDRHGHLKNNSRCLKQFYDSLNDEYQKFYSGTRRSLGS